MAQVFGPLMSIEAKGTISKTLTFAIWKGRQYCKQRFVPHNPKSVRQVARRQTMKDGVSKWRWRDDLVTADNKTSWASYGKKTMVSGFNRFMKFYMEENYDKVSGTVVSPQIVPQPM